MSTQPTQNHQKIAYEILFATEDGPAIVTKAAQLIADSEARAVEVAFPDSKDDSLYNVRRLRAELAEVKANFKEERRFLIAEIKELNAELRREAALVSKIDQLETELAQLRAELAKIYSLVAPHGCDLAPNGIYETARVVSDLLDQLRAENERLKDHAFDKDGTPWKTVCGWWAKKYDAAERQMRENAARAERAEAEVERLNKAIKVDTPKMVKLNNEILTENGRLLARAEKAEAEVVPADKIERHLIADGWIMRADDEALDHNCETWWRLDSHPSGKYMIGNKYARCFFVPVRRNGPLPPLDDATKEGAK